jgi:hypothetical protein
MFDKVISMSKIDSGETHAIKGKGIIKHPICKQGNKVD